MDGPRPTVVQRDGLAMSLEVDGLNPACLRKTQVFAPGGATVEPVEMPAFLEAMG